MHRRREQYYTVLCQAWGGEPWVVGCRIVWLFLLMCPEQGESVSFGLGCFGDKCNVGESWESRGSRGTGRWVMNGVVFGVSVTSSWRRSAYEKTELRDSVHSCRQ